MSENFNHSSSETIPAQEASLRSAKAGLSSEAMARRHMLIKSLGKGSAVVAAAAVPMHSLASTGTLAVTANGQRCTISGTMSGVHSRETITAVCAGMSPGYYKTLSHWPNYNASSNPTANNAVTGGVGTFNKDTTFASLFGSGSNLGLLETINATNTYQVEFHWIAALLNGTAGSSAQNFPYTAAEVIALYVADAGMGKNGPGWKFFSGYMETL